MTCTYEARSRGGDKSGSEAWCTTHGWHCPNAGTSSAARRTADDAPYAAALRLMSKSGRFSATDRETLAQIAAHLESSSAPSSAALTEDSEIKAALHHLAEPGEVINTEWISRLLRRQLAPPATALTRAELDALIDFHDYNDAGAEAMDCVEQSKYHAERSKHYAALRDALPPADIQANDR